MCLFEFKRYHPVFLLINNQSKNTLQIAVCARAEKKSVTAFKWKIQNFLKGLPYTINTGGHLGEAEVSLNGHPIIYKHRAIRKHLVGHLG
jgi:hypothetical protein